MIDFHNNVFYYYRGSQPRGGQLYDQQLENNTTKALANTLIHTGPEVANKFLDWLGIRGKGKLQVALQRKTIGEQRIAGTRHRLLLGIAGRRAGQENSAGSTIAETVKGDGTPDTWLYGDDYLVLIESKVGDAPLRQAQMGRHFQSCAGGHGGHGG
jgi:hypothetical protein